MYSYFIFLLCILTLNPCITQAATQNITTITAHPIRRPRQSSASGSGRLSLINYRFNRRPKKKNLDIGELKSVLGNSYDPKFMAIERPPELSGIDAAGVTYDVRKDSWRYGEMLQELQAGNLTRQLQDIAGDEFDVSQEYVKVVEKWLIKKASCPVRYAWEDIGALFWPRYIRRGECSSEQGSCSWPSGMHCVPSGTTNIHLLRWQCRTPRGGKGRKRGYKGPMVKNYKEDDKPVNLKCHWVRVPYPITNECMCTC